MRPTDHTDRPDSARNYCTRAQPEEPKPDYSAGSTVLRAQSHVLGAILLFGILVLLLGLIQMTAVPDWNQSLEVDHSQTVQEDIDALSGSIHQTAVTGQSTTSGVQIGLRYPTRPFLFNPPDPAGRLQTVDAGSIELDNVDFVGVDNYWVDEDPNQFAAETSHLVYQPDYNEFETPPTTRYENGIVFNRFDGTTLPLSTRGFLDGERISLVALAGDLEREAAGKVQVPVRPESAPSQTVGLTSATDDPITVSVPTTYPESEWESLLEGEFQSNGGHIVGDAAGVAVEDGELTVALDPDVEYDLRLARVTIDDRANRTAPHYLTHTSGGETAIRPTQSERLTFEVRDRFNNGKHGVDVSFEASEGTLSRTSARTAPDGTVSVRYIAPSGTGVETVTATAEFGDEETVGENQVQTVPVQVDDDAPRDQFVWSNPGPDSGNVLLVDSPRNNTGTDLTFRNTGTTEKTLQQVRMSFYYPRDDVRAPTRGNYTYQNTRTEFDIPGEFEAVTGPTLAPAGEEGDEAEVWLRDLRSNPVGDFFVLHTVWTDAGGESDVQSYFVGVAR